MFVLKEKSHDEMYPLLRMHSEDGTQVSMREYRPGDEATAPEGTELSVYLRRGLEWGDTILAERATYTQRDGVWGLALEGGRRIKISDKRQVTPQDWIGPEEFHFTPELALTFRRARDNPLELSYAEARELGSRDPDNVVYQTLSHYHLTFPLANLVLLIVGLPLLMQHERGSGAEGLAKGLLLCLFFFAADFVCRNLGVQGTLDPLLASWLPVLFFGSLGVVLYVSQPT